MKRLAAAAVAVLWACAGPATPADDADDPARGGAGAAGAGGGNEPAAAGRPAGEAGQSAGGGGEPGMDDAAGGAGGAAVVPPTPPGMNGPGLDTLPTLPANAKDPLAGIPPVQRVLAGALLAHVEHLSWQPPNRLFFTAYPGNAIAKEPDDVGIHPFRVWRLTETASQSTVNEFFLFPTASEIEENAWCKWTQGLAAFWCFSYQQKTNKFVMRIPDPGDVAGPLRVAALDGVEKWSTAFLDPATQNEGSRLHDRMLDSIELKDGTLYWTHKAGLSTRTTRVLMSRPARSTKPLLTQVLVGAAGMEDPYGLTASPDDKVLYFTVAGFGSDDKTGSLWAADILADGTLAKPHRLVAGIPKPRRLTCDEFGNLYVASGHEVRVYAPNGAAFGTIPVITDADHLEALRKSKAPFSLLSAEFGGPSGNVLYMGLGTDMGLWTVHNSLQSSYIKVGGLFRVTIAARGAWFVRHGVR